MNTMYVRDERDVGQQRHVVPKQAQQHVGKVTQQQQQMQQKERQQQQQPPIKYENYNSNDADMRDEEINNSIYKYCEGNLNFSTITCSEDDGDYGPTPHQKKTKISRQDPMSHRIIEKRRRDRMNNCLADLSRLIPADYLKKGRGRIEKTEIIEMAIKHMKFLQQNYNGDKKIIESEHYRLGYQECMSEVMRFLVEFEGYMPNEPLCAKLVNHLQRHSEVVLASDRLSNPIAQNNFDKLNVDHAPQVLLSFFKNENVDEKTRAPDAEFNDKHDRVNDEIKRVDNYTAQRSETPSDMDHATDHVTSTFENFRKRLCVSPTDDTPVSPRYDAYDRAKHDLTGEQQLPRDQCVNGASLYKFKNNLMQRISQELRPMDGDVSVASTNCAVGKRRRYTTESRRLSQTRKAHSIDYASYSNGTSPTECSRSMPEPPFIPVAHRLPHVTAETNASPTNSSGSDSKNDANVRDNGHSPTGSSVSDNKQNGRFLNFNTKVKNESGSSSCGSNPTSGKDTMSCYVPNKLDCAQMDRANFNVPVFVLHSKGSFYVPLTIDYYTLVPFLRNYNIVDCAPTFANVLLHPVTINVSYHASNASKRQKYRCDVQRGWQ